MDQRSPVGLVRITLGVVLVAGLAAVSVPLPAQNADALYAGRSCNQDFARLRAVGVTDVADSGPLVAALREAADSAAPLTKVVTGMPNRFMATIVRLNRRDMIDISSFPFTCPPGESSTPQAMRIAREGRRFPSPAPRDAMVQLWLRSSGEVADAWIVRSSGRRELDSLALEVVRVLRYTPPLVGTTPVATLLQVPVRF